MKNEFSLLSKLFRKPARVSTDSLKHIGTAQELHSLSDDEKKLLRKSGITNTDLQKAVQKELEVNYDRTIIYREVDRAREHWMMSSALGLYADTVTSINSLMDRSVWVTSENTKYVNELTKLLDRIGIEEKIYDWAWSISLYGDLFPKVEGQPGYGIISVDDSGHPVNLSRIDVNGVLVGFFNTTFGEGNGQNALSIIPPWEYVHFRLLGAKRRRQQGGDPTFQEYRTSYLMSGDNRLASSNYGASVLIDGIPVWKRLRLSDDSILMTRLTRGLLKYIYKVRVDSWETESVSELIDEYVTLLKRARAINTDASNPSYDSKFGVMGGIEDLIVPVWGESGDVSIEKIGGDPDIRWITDVDKLEDQLAMALRVPRALLGGSAEDATGSLGSEAVTALGIQFSKTAKRLQRALIQGITRICQIHLAYMNMDPDTALFDVKMSETSTAEEEQLKETLSTGADIIDKYLDMFNRMQESNPALEFNQIEFFTYMNQKILKLNDLDINDYVTVKDVVDDIDEVPEGVGPVGDIGAGVDEFEELEGADMEDAEALPDNMAPPEELPVEGKKLNKSTKTILSEYNKNKKKKVEGVKKSVQNLDLTAPLPLKTPHKHIMERSKWEKQYGETKIKLTEKKGK